MKRLIWLLIILVGLLGAGFAARMAMASNTDNHTVTVTVSAINEIDVSGPLTLTISTATAGSEPNAALDSTSTLAWTTNEASKKITVATNLPSPKFTLKALATSVNGGTAAAEVTLSTLATNFVTGIATTTGSCTIKYTASATAAQGTGSDSHTVTYTITAV